MNVCENILPGGINGDCLLFPKPVSGVIITASSFELANIDAAQNYNTWRIAIQESLTAYTTVGVEGYESTTDDPTINTTTKGSKIFVRKGVPSMVAYITANNCDFNEMQNTLKSGTYRVFFILEDNTLWGYLTTDAKYKGFKAEVTAAGMGIPAPDTIENSFPLYINFKLSQEFNRAVNVALAWSAMPDLSDAMPLGLSMIITTALTTSDVVVHIQDRCGSDRESLVVGDFEVLDSNNLTSPAVTAAADDGNGAYTLTVQKEATPEDLAAGDWVIIRVKNVTGSVVNLLSNRMTVQA